MVPSDELEDLRARPRHRRVITYVLIAAAVAVLVFLLQPAGEREAPSFVLPRLDRIGSLSDEDFRGEPVVINFWASWCIPCREEARTLQRAWEEFEGEGVRFLGVNVQDTSDSARRFVEDFGITFPVVRDADQELARDLGVYGLPQTFFIDHTWRLASSEAGEQIGREGGTVVLGAVSARELRAHIERLLEAQERN
jgi:cytochrome c biogenesis protein CcmG, thiol:disulfide interchange protein DsbE